MGLFDLFSNDKAEEAAQQRKDGLQQGYDALTGAYQQGRDALTTGANTASSLWQNYGNTVGQMYGSGAAAYGDVSGANGVEGLQRGTDLFKNSGQYGVYGVGLQEGLQALNRTHAAAGNLSSGNADADTIKFAQDQASKAYGQFQTGLQPYLTLNGQAQALATKGQADAATGLGTGLNTNYMGQGAAANANYTGQGAADAAATMNNYNVGANIFNALKGGADFVAGGGISNFANGAKSGASSLFSMFA